MATFKEIARSMRPKEREKLLRATAEQRQIDERLSALSDILSKAKTELETTTFSREGFHHCGKCNRFFASASRLKVHAVDCQGMTVQVPNGEIPYCPFCKTYRATNLMREYHDHLLHCKESFIKGDAVAEIRRTVEMLRGTTDNYQEFLGQIQGSV